MSAVADVDLGIAEGEFFSLLGPSGCGKTTLLRLIAGLEVPTGGSILVDGSDVTRLPPQNREIGIVFQNYALFPHMTVFGNIAYGLEVRHEPSDAVQTRVRGVLSKIGLAEKERIPVTQLSGGEQQRVALARAIVVRPRLLLFDEPLSNLDHDLRLQTRGEIKRLQREEGITTIYVTHDQGEALALSDRIAVMNKGRICEVGTPQDLYLRPKSRFTAAFIGHANLFTGGESRRLFGVDVVKSGEFLAVLPEEVRLEPAEKGEGEAISAVEYSGSSTIVTVGIGGRSVTALVPSAVSAWMKPGVRVTMRLAEGERRMVRDDG